MSNKSIYSSFIESKTGVQIPVLLNGKTLESRYNPQSEAQKKLLTVDLNQNFFIIIGICSGTLINELLQKNPNAMIIGIESCEDDITFLTGSPDIALLQKKNNVILCTPDNLVQTLINTYIPSFYGNLQIIEQQSWCIENPTSYNKIKVLLSKSLEYISRDFSVQSHFGKLWQNNILNNLQLLKDYNLKFSENLINTKKEAVIVAAGPSLDSKLSEIKNNTNNFIIATDTAYSTLLKTGIFCNCVVSIDPQQISYNHFINSNLHNSETLFIFDITGNHSVCKNLVDNNKNVLFTVNNHPFSKYINECANHCFPTLFSGAGTVTIGALDFAVQCGFEKIKVIGADFSYINNKPYGKGTYLDSLYFLQQNKIATAEKNFTSLMYRTVVTKTKNNIIKTTVLDSYENSFIEYLQTLNATYRKENNEYIISIPSNQRNLYIKSQKNNIIDVILKEFSKENNSFIEKNTINSLKNTDICLLPLISWLRNNENIVEDNFSNLLKIAYSIILRFD